MASHQFSAVPSSYPPRIFCLFGGKHLAFKSRSSLVYDNNSWKHAGRTGSSSDASGLVRVKERGSH